MEDPVSQGLTSSTTFLFDTLGPRKDSEEEALQLTPSSITISEAIYTLDTSNSFCSSRCAKSEVMDEAEAPPAVTRSEESVLAQATVRDNTDQVTVKVVESSMSELMDQEVVPYRGKRRSCYRLGGVGNKLSSNCSYHQGS